MSDETTREREQLIAQARELGVDGVLSRMRDDTLRAKIADAESLAAGQHALEAEAPAPLPVPAAAPSAEPDEPLYTVRRLRTERILPGVQRFVIAGALAEYGDDHELTQAEALANVERFLTAEDTTNKTEA